MNLALAATMLMGLVCVPTYALTKRRDQEQISIGGRERTLGKGWFFPLTQLMLGAVALDHFLWIHPASIAFLLLACLLLSKPLLDRTRNLAPILAFGSGIVVTLLCRHSYGSVYQLNSSLNLQKFSVTAIWLCAAIFLGGSIVEIALRAATKISKFENSDPAHSSSSRVIEIGGLLHGGQMIGWIERVVVFFTIVIHQPAGIALVVAVKSVARFPEFRPSGSGDVDDRLVQGKVEAFIIGTLLSIFVAGLSARIALFTAK